MLIKMNLLKMRTIQDCLACAYQFLYMCHTSRKEIFIFKLDFEKAFDKVEHHAILAMLQPKGFLGSGLVGSNKSFNRELIQYF